MRTTHVVQPFLSKTWAYRQLMSLELDSIWKRLTEFNIKCIDNIFFKEHLRIFKYFKHFEAFFFTLEVLFVGSIRGAQRQGAQYESQRVIGLRISNAVELKIHILFIFLLFLFQV